jgi:hypothetical protein
MCIWGKCKHIKAFTFYSDAAMAVRRGAQNRLLQRLHEAVEKHYGEVRTDTLHQLADRAGVHYTVLAKFLWYQEPRLRTNDIRESNLRKIAIALDTTTQWLRFGVKAQQRDMWPFPLPSGSAASEADPADDVRAMLRELRRLPHGVQVRACREAVATMLSVVSASGAEVSREGYGCLIRLDYLQRAAVA